MSTTTASPQWQGRVLEGWNPEEAEHWSSQIAWRTLAITTFSLILGFAVWFLPNAIAPKLNDLGFELSKTQLYWLTSMPGLSCAALRMVYMFLPATIGTRKMVYWSSLLYVLPMIGWFFAVQNPNTSFALLLLLSFACGIGAATFSGYMPSTGFFFPKRLQGTALGLQGGLGNLGMSVIQLSAPFLMSMSLFGVTWIAPKAAANPPVVVNAVIFFIPWSLLAALLAFLFLKDVPLKANVKEQLDIFGNPNTWYMTVLYIMTFGLFSGFGAQTALIINNNFGKLSPLAESFNPDTLPVGLSYAFLGTLIGAVLRFAWGPLCDKFGGAIWTFVSAIGMALTLSWCGWVLMTTDDPSDFTPFLMGMLAMFFFAGVGNASTFKQMPMIMPKRQAGGAQGFTGAVAALGPFLVGVALTLMPAHVFYFVAASYCVLCAVLCWMRYARPGAPFPG
ncbi:NarK/NasA family nitrate transporter [Schaalia cardiffensis]|uniref:MFS transporter n=1 Tax=Schaalia cardiffensis TaxID=181487 RepID=UPI0018E8B4DC|nr:MFS transporter [Schaalia cardiffensis]MBJ2328752.1 NarK/NasA family nitrate transporter [Schaalia cardiffensis]